VLAPFQRLNGRILIALDGTEHFCSRKIHCARCSTRKRSDGGTEYFHTFLGASIVAPGPAAPAGPSGQAQGHGSSHPRTERKSRIVNATPRSPRLRGGRLLAHPAWSGGHGRRRRRTRRLWPRPMENRERNVQRAQDQRIQSRTQFRAR
jgi:hypothetical protein